MTDYRTTQLQGITDLSLVATIKPGLIEHIFDSRSYAWRLQRVLELLDAARRAARESDLTPSPLIDGVARLRGIHFFRFAIVPAERLGSGQARLFLNVTFDGGWEPYMRLIWKPLGTLLDLIFCHCTDYPLAAVSSYDDYIAWVRSNEVPSQFFYADSGGSVADRAYLNQLEAQQRHGGQRQGADLQAAQLALQPLQPPQPSMAAVTGALRMLKGLAALRPLFGAPALPAAGVSKDDASVLLRFTQDLLPELRDWVAQTLFDPGQRFDALRPPFEAELRWLMTKHWTRPELADPQPFIRPQMAAQLQAGILDSPKAAGRVVRGALVLLQVNEAAAARAWLRQSSTPGPKRLFSDGSTVALEGGEVLCTVAITYPGLVKLEVHADHLGLLPAEFVQGMEARAGILGDVRINHPQQWIRPRKADRREPVELGLVHLVIQLRTGEIGADPQDQRQLLLPRLGDWIKDQLSAKDGIEVLAVEPCWARPARAGEPSSRDHFGYVDGISQPSLNLSAGNQYWDDGVKTGELLLGWVNDRGDGPLKDAPPAARAWTWMGTFLVLRKLQQYVDRFDGLVEAAAKAVLAVDETLEPDAARELVRAKLMGRSSDGSPLVVQRGVGGNDFDYRYDADAAQCPFASHVRRANPRVTLPGGMRTPRILRRGMAYGVEPERAQGGRDQQERGVLFMAYNASIAEQFEVVQRWLAGGNSSGVSASQPDPFLGVPCTGEPVVYRFTHGDQVVRVNLGDQPVTRLQWGLYAFVPSLALLGGLDALTDPLRAPTPAPTAAPTPAPTRAPKGGPPAPTPAPAADPQDQRVKAEFEDDLRREERWKIVRKADQGVEKIGSHVMVGSLAAVRQVLHDDGSAYSAAGYGQRMEKTLGACPFGQDDAGAGKGHDRPFVAAVKQAIGGAVTEEQAYGLAFGIVTDSINKQRRTAGALGLPVATVDTLAVGVELMAGLLSAWFGVDYKQPGVVPGPNADGASPVRCPGHFLAVARYVFSARPNPTVEARAQAQGATLDAAVKQWIANAKPGALVMAAVLKAMEEPLKAGQVDAAERDATVANVMLGLPATLLGTWAKVLMRWIANRRLWALQHRLPGQPIDHAAARKELYEELIRTMAIDPVADGIWRTASQAHKLGSVNVEKDDAVWLGLGSALAGAKANLQTAEELLFGGPWTGDPKTDATHACPGRGLAIGALLGGLAALLAAGELAATPSPTTLTLKLN